ncbi:uncharacterized protein LOC123679011 [Harmonia axyridis]|uniref:uncharacterized protein LOC123679011 n=1 Tax=Harmonia axyridis TaxID=115357 RepID=UPI001E278DB8|nr:uncharacterized protein LOC123679011 [Harmonia axyridis]XP_045472278.1 uncharacterized protein LOC123679011 [Harmonia axyridis]
MEFLGELNFLSVIEEELEFETTDYQVRENWNELTENKKSDERKSSRIPVRQVRTQMVKKPSENVEGTSKEDGPLNAERNFSGNPVKSNDEDVVDGGLYESISNSEISVDPDLVAKYQSSSEIELIRTKLEDLSGIHSLRKSLETLLISKEDNDSNRSKDGPDTQVDRDTKVEGSWLSPSDNFERSNPPDGDRIDPAPPSPLEIPTDSVENAGSDFCSGQEHFYFREAVQSFLLAELGDKSCFDITSCSLVPASARLVCKESEEPILEAPAEFRNGPGGSEASDGASDACQAPPPQPPSVPEEESPNRDDDNTNSTETGDTTQRSGKNGPYDWQSRESEREKQALDTGGTASVLVTYANSTEDNDHIELEGDNRNVSAFEHVGNVAPIQRHDMLQIDRGETAEPLESSAVPQSRQCQIDRGGCGSLGEVLRASETYDCSASENRAKDVCGDRVEDSHYSSFVPDVLSFEECGYNSSKIPDLSCSVSDSGSSSDSYVSSVRNFLIEEFLDDVPEMFSDRYKFKFSAVVGDQLGEEKSLVGEQDDNNNVSGIDELFVRKNWKEERSSTDPVVPAPSSTPASFSPEDGRGRVTSDAHLLGDRPPSNPPGSIHAESCVPAPAPGCSPTKTAAPKGCVVSRQALLPGCTSSNPEFFETAEKDAEQEPNAAPSPEPKNLRWSFKNGRLVFDSESDVNDNKVAAPDSSKQEVESGGLRLSSKDINKRIDENKSRLRYLEEKLLKNTGIGQETKEGDGGADVAEQVVEDCGLKTERGQGDRGESDRTVRTLEVNGNDYDEDYAEGLTSFTGGEDFCQFDVSQISSFSSVLNGYCLVYDELNQGDDSDEEYHVISLDEDAELEEQFYILRNLKAKMGTDSERPKHNPDAENLKSLLKRPGRNRDKKSNRVVFNENKNEFFDADYIILIREECDYDDEDDDSVCTCNQHEMVRLTCCEPNCNCSVYEGYDPTPQSPKFAPPLEFVDAVTLSPPEGYKDMELEEQELFALQQMARRGQQRHAVCRECSATHDDNDDEGDSSQSDDGGGPHSDLDDPGEREKTDQSQQTTPTTPENCIDDSDLHDFSLDRPQMPTTERGYSSDEERREERPTPSIRLNVPAGGSPISGILKGGKLWKQSSLDGGNSGSLSNKTLELQQNTDSSATSDEEGSQRRFVRFIETESNGQRDGCDGASDEHTQEEVNKERSAENDRTKQENCHNSVSPDTTEMMLTFKLGNHVLISNNSLKPNSAVRQLFPCTKPSTAGKDEESAQQYLVTAESLRAFEEAKRSKLPQIIQSGETDESIKKAIERNTLRRSLIRYEPRSRKNQPKTDNSLVERIKQLTCDVDDVQIEQEETEAQTRASPPGEEARNSPEVTALKQQDKTFSPSSSSTSSSNASSVSSTYKKITDLFTKKSDKPLDNQNNVVHQNNSTQETKITPTLPDLGNGPHELDHAHVPAARINSTTNESRKQFLSSLAPLTACVSGITNVDDYYYQMNNHVNHVGERASMASSVGTEYSLEDIDEALRTDQEDNKRITPDVLAGTPSASESGDELAMFVQQDASRIERIKKKYQAESNKEEDDEHDDYGFNKRPSVRGIKPRFGTTTQIIQEIQNQMQPPEAAARISWPYYSESGLSNVDNPKAKNPNQNLPQQYPAVAPEEFKARGYPPPYRPTSLTEENMYQSGQYCRQVYRTNGNPNSYPTVMKVGARCNETYQSLPRQKSSGRPLSPPPSEVSRTYHQTMVYIPYNHIEGCQTGVSSNVYYQHSDYARVSNQNQINKRYIEPVYQQRFHMHVEDHHYHYNTSVMTQNAPKQLIRIPYPQQPHSVNARSESPLQFTTAARGTQTPVPNCNYYSNPRYRPVSGTVWQGDSNYVSKMNRHSFPMGTRYSTSDTSTDTDSGQGIPTVQNGYRQSIEISFPPSKDALGSSPTKPKFTERGVPEGAASVSPPDTIKMGKSNSSTMTSPTSPQGVSIQSQKPMFYAMNV